MIFDCFKAKDRSPTIPNQSVVIPTTAREAKNLRILFLPGHGDNEGANTYRADINEAYWNRLVVTGVNEGYQGKHTLFRDPKNWRRPARSESYSTYCKRIAKLVKDKDIDLVIEQHINAAGVPEARGTESLILYGHDSSAFYANRFSSTFRSAFKIVPRGTYKNYRGVKGLSRKRKDRGVLFLEQCCKAGAATFLQEPFFGDYRTTDSKQFLDHLDSGVGKMVDFYISVLKTL